MESLELTRVVVVVTLVVMHEGIGIVCLWMPDGVSKLTDVLHCGDNGP